MNAAANSSAGSRRATGSSGSFEFNDLAPPPETRVIRIPLEDLRNGDLKYNIVIRPRDTLVVPYAEYGTYYMGGHVGRPGAYALNGQKVTPDGRGHCREHAGPVGIPDRTDVVRRIGPDRQVFVRLNLRAGVRGEGPGHLPEARRQGDGGHQRAGAVPPRPLAPGLPVYLTGLGFIYDRNFAYDDNFQAR
jgi:hypothetical protein